MEECGENCLAPDKLNHCVTTESRSSLCSETDENDGLLISDKNCIIKLKKPHLPNTSIDESPFMEFKSTRMKKKNVQSKLMYLRKNALKQKLEESKCNVNLESESHPPISFVSTEHENFGESTVSNVLLGKSHENKETKLICPLCWKKFEKKETRTSHIKTCAVKHNLTLNQMMDAVDLQIKQTAERKALGLPGLPDNFTARKTSKKSSNSKDGEDLDFQLGVALSVSLRDAEEQKLVQEQDVLMEAGLGREVVVAQASLLERFGFTSLRSVPLRTGKLKLRGQPPLLFLQSQEERERLITEKVAIILMGEEDFVSAVEQSTLQLSEPSICLKSEVLCEVQNKVCKLWKMASASPSVDDGCSYYVQHLCNVISPSKVQVGVQLRHIAQVPSPLETPIGNYSEDGLNDVCNVDESPILNLSCSSQFSQQSLKLKHESSLSSTKLQETSGFVRDLLQDWRNLLETGRMSDIAVFVKNGEKINVHELVLNVRCPAILSDVKVVNSNVSLIKSLLWNEIPYRSAYAFLEFIYCGTISKIVKLDDEFDSAIVLARRYHLEELYNHLRLVENIRKRRNDSIVSYSKEHNSIQSHDSVIPEVNEDNSQSILLAKYRSPRKDGSKFELKSDVKCNIDNYPEVILDTLLRNEEENKSGSICLSPDPFLDCNLEESERKNTSTQHDIDHLINLLGSSSSLSCHSRVLKETNSHRAICEDKGGEENCSSQMNKSLQTFPKLKRKHLDKNINDQGTDDMKTKRVRVKDKLSVRTSLLEKFMKSTSPRQGDDVLMNDFMQSNGKSCIKTLILPPPLEKSCVKTLILPPPLEKSCIKTLILPPPLEISSKEHKTLSSPQINEKQTSVSHFNEERCNSSMLDLSQSSGMNSISRTLFPDQSLSLEKDYKEPRLKLSVTQTEEKSLEDLNQTFSQYNNEKRCSFSEHGSEHGSESVPDPANALGDFCADFEYNYFCSNYSPDKTPEKNFAVERSQDRMSTLKTVKRSVSRSSMSPPSEKKISSSFDATCTEQCMGSPLSSPLSMKCLSQEEFHLKSSNGTIKRGSESSDELPEVPLSQTMLNSLSCGEKKNLLHNHSLNSVKHMLEDSFVDELATLSHSLAIPCSTPNEIKARKQIVPETSSGQKRKRKQNSVTPMADYSAMNTPLLKRELSKYGLKPLKKNQAKLILRHIYNELHPWVPVSGDKETSPSCDTQGKTESSKVINMSLETQSPNKKRTNSASQGTDDFIEENNDTSVTSSQESATSSSQTDIVATEEMTNEIDLTQTDHLEIGTAVQDHFKSDHALYVKVLSYEPIWLEELHNALKEKNYKFKLQHLTEYLDEQVFM